MSKRKPKLSELPEQGNSTKPLLPAVPSSEVYLEDCVKALKRFNDNHFDLAIVDPPYGIGMAKGIEVGKWKRKIHTTKDWDDATPMVVVIISALGLLVLLGICLL